MKATLDLDGRLGVGLAWLLIRGNSLEEDNHVLVLGSKG